MTTAGPPPGFFDDPEDAGRQRWWDGQKWTDVTQKSKSLPDVSKVAGGALIADGVVGFGRNRQGILGAIFGIFLGTGIAIVFAFFLAPSMSEQGTLAVPTPADATVIAVARPTDSSSSSASCGVTIRYLTREGQTVESATSFSSSALCSYGTGQVVPITYDAANVGRFQGLDSTGDLLGRWFPWIFVGAGVLIALGSLWTLIVRVTQIGGGIYLLRRSRRKDRERP